MDNTKTIEKTKTDERSAPLKKYKVLIAESGSGYGGTAKYLTMLLPLIDENLFDVNIVSYGEGPFITRVRENWPVEIQKAWRFETRVDLPPTALAHPAWRQKLDKAFLVVWTLIKSLIRVPYIGYWLIKNKYDLIHLNNEIRAHLPLLLAANIMGCKVICHMHGWRDLTRMEKIAAQYVDQFVCVTQAGARFYETYLKRMDVVAIPNGLPVDKAASPNQELRIRKRQELGLDEKARLVTIVGRLVPLKGQNVFLESFAKALKETPELHGLIVGDTATADTRYLGQLKALISSLGIDHKVSWVGWQNDMTALYEASDIVVQPSVEAESFGYVALEAMLAGKPVIASRIGGLVDVIKEGETGFLVQAGNADELAGKLVKIATHPDLAQTMGEKGRKRVQTTFTMDRNASRIMDIYSRLLEEERT